jgi:hypothetical protein
MSFNDEIRQKASRGSFIVASEPHPFNEQIRRMAYVGRLVQDPTGTRGEGGRFTNFNDELRAVAFGRPDPDPEPIPEDESPEAAAFLARERAIDAPVIETAKRFGFKDPDDAAKMIPREALNLDDEGRPDPKALTDAVRDLALRKRHLVNPAPSWDGGARTSLPPAVDFNEAIREAYWKSRMERGAL